MDTLVFDIETQNFFTDPGVGRDNFNALRISVVGAYSYTEDKYFCFEELEMGKIVDLFDQAGRIVGFSINRYDVPVLNHYVQRQTSGRLNLWHKDRVDLLEEIEVASGSRVSLSRLAEANLGVAKDHHGSEAIAMYREGRIGELKAYCLKDVELTKRLYDLFRERGYLFVPDRETGEIVKMEFAVPAQAAKLF
jgi:DEAD/DEAH box helicase domain-containing protein